MYVLNPRNLGNVISGSCVGIDGILHCKYNCTKFTHDGRLTKMRKVGLLSIVDALDRGFTDFYGPSGDNSLLTALS